MKKTLPVIIIFISLIFNFGSCSDPIFHYLSEEIELNDPKINGSPTRFLEFNGYLWVASGKKLWKYSKETGWKSTNLNSKIRDIAVTDNYFYACLENSNKGIIKRYDRNINAVEDDRKIAFSFNNLQSMYAVGDILFVSDIESKSRKFKNYSILDSSSDPVVISIDQDSNFNQTMLNGIAYDDSNYYLCSISGIFYMPKDSDPLDSSILIPGSNLGEAKGFTGIISLNGTVAAVSRNLSIYIINQSGIGEKAVASFASSSKYVSSGALGIWTENSDPASTALLLVGRQDSLNYSENNDYTHGYVEAVLNPDRNGIVVRKDKDNKDYTYS